MELSEHAVCFADFTCVYAESFLRIGLACYVTIKLSFYDLFCFRLLVCLREEFVSLSYCLFQFNLI